MSFPSFTDNGSNVDNTQKELLQNAIIHFAQTGKAIHFTHTKSYFKHITIILTVGIAFASFLAISIYTDDVEVSSELKTGYEIKNLRGDTVDTWLTWRVPDDDLFHVHVEKSKMIDEKKTQAIFDVIMSWDTIDIDDSLLHKGPSGHSSTYFKGWYGALQSITENTEFTIPQNLHFHVTDKGEGDILIYLTDRSSPDGYSGYTTSIVDENNNQILKSKITIYDADKLSIEELKTIVRHELGHGFGLAHSSAPEDLMHHVIETNYPYISECDIAALTALYDGSKKSSVVCEK